MRIIARKVLLAAVVLQPLFEFVPATANATTADRPLAQIYKLESVEISGTTRITSDQLATELDLVPGTPLDDNLVMTTQARLLGLGLFKSAILVMRKGSAPGKARLIVEVEDDPNVLGDWALGGELGVTVTEAAASSVESGAAPMDYRLGLVGRNVFSSLHRGSAFIDLSDEGDIRQAQLAYGMPRFAREEAQFDAEIAVVDPYYRYLDTLGFGARGQGLWSHTVPDLGELQYGAAMYVNRRPHFAVPGFPDTVAGPKFAFFKESRLHGFFPGDGSLVGASLLLSPIDTEQSVIELNLSRTWDLARIAYLTLDGRMLSVGVDGYAVRAEGRVDVPLGFAAPGEDQAAAFLRLRSGKDSIGKVNLAGTAAIFGVRYHSSGLIAELALKITRAPEELAPEPMSNLPEELP